MESIALFIDTAPTFRVAEGLAHVEFRSGGGDYHLFMSEHLFDRAILLASGARAEGHIESLDAAERPSAPIPIGRGRRR